RGGSRLPARLLQLLRHHLRPTRARGEPPQLLPWLQPDPEVLLRLCRVTPGGPMTSISGVPTRPHDSLPARGLAGAALLALAFAACGGGGSPSSPSTPTPIPAPTPTPNPATTIVLKATGASPKPLQVPVGTRVTFWNQDVVAHQMASDPHPIH